MTERKISAKAWEAAGFGPGGTHKKNPITPEMVEPLWRDLDAEQLSMRECGRMLVQLIPQVYDTRRIFMTEMG